MLSAQVPMVHCLWCPSDHGPLPVVLSDGAQGVNTGAKEFKCSSAQVLMIHCLQCSTMGFKGSDLEPK